MTTTFLKEDTQLFAEEALALIHSPRVLHPEALSTKTLAMWRDHVNAGFLKYRKSMGDGDSGAKLDWADANLEDLAHELAHAHAHDPDPIPDPIPDLPRRFQYSRSWILDAKHERYLDCLSGFGVFNVGHKHPGVLGTVSAQLRKQPLHSQEFLDPLRAYAAKLLAHITGLSHAFFVNSGAEAVEAALKLAMLHTGRNRVLACVNGFHGKTLGALSTTSKALFRAPFAAALNDVVHTPFNDVSALAQAFATAEFTGTRFAALILEPVQGEGGIHVAHPDFMAEARELCTAHGTCLVLDEVQTGMGRTGCMFAMEHFRVVPDLLCIGKSLSGGVVPVAACCGSAALWTKCVEAPFLFTTTFGGNPLACAAAIATVHALVAEDMCANARARGQQLRKGLCDLQEAFPAVIKEVRGLGLMLGVEFWSNDLGVAWSRALLKRHVLVSGTLISATSVRVCPPLVITADEIDLALRAMQGACQEATAVAMAAPSAKL
jgi:putrescine aminotransferase